MRTFSMSFACISCGAHGMRVEVLAERPDDGWLAYVSGHSNSGEEFEITQTLLEGLSERQYGGMRLEPTALFLAASRAPAFAFSRPRFSHISYGVSSVVARRSVGVRATEARMGLKEQLLDRALDWFKNSEAVAKKHQEHIESDSVVHMMKGTPMAGAPDELKLKFVDDVFGKMMADFMRREQEVLGEWKVGKVVEAAGPEFDSQSSIEELRSIVDSVPVVVLSFVDCPWCLAAKRLLQELALPFEAVRIIELEDLSRRGKYLRAAAALATGRTSMPNIFIGGRSVGGFTDGYSESAEVPEPTLCMQRSPGLQALHESSELKSLIRDALDNA